MYTVNAQNFSKIPGRPIAYWLNMNNISNFSKLLERALQCKTGLICGNNEKYIRFWYEPNFYRLMFSCNEISQTNSSYYKWFPYNHGGERRKWYGNHNEVVNMADNACGIRSEKNAMLRNSEFYFKKGITWNRIGSGIKFAARIAGVGFVFDDVSPSGFSDENSCNYILGYMNSKVFNEYLRLYCTALKVEIRHISKVPFVGFIKESDVCNITTNSTKIAKSDCDSFETSWDFKKHPLI